MAYTTDIVYDTPETRSRTRQRNRHLLFILLFVLGTMVAAIGWFAGWEHLYKPIDMYHYAAIIAVVGHGMQVIGAFGSLLTPDYVEEEE